MRFISIDKSKQMANGMRMQGNQPLSPEEIEIVRKEIKRIKADESVFIFNDPNHLRTCYVSSVDKVFIGRNVFPETRYGSFHPRDIMSVASVLAHEYYGHRMFRDEYIQDDKNGTVTTPEWEDEVRASINAAKITPNLTRMEQANLIQDAIYRAQEYGAVLENDDFMKEVLYGYPNDERHITGRFNERIVLISAKSQNRDANQQKSKRELPEVPEPSDSEDMGLEF